MGVGLAIFILLACGFVSAYMARARDAATGSQYTFLIGIIAVMGSCLVILASHAPGVTPSTIVVLTSAWIACSVASLNTSVNPGMSLMFALFFSVFVALGLFEGGRGPLSVWMSLALTLAWLSVGWLVRYNKLNPGAIPLLLIASAPLFARPAY